MPCDVPRISVELLRRLIDAPDAPLAALHVEGREHPESLALRISASWLPEVRQLLDDGRRAVHHLFANSGMQCVSISEVDAVALANVNTPQEYEAVRPRSAPPHS